MHATFPVERPEDGHVLHDDAGLVMRLPLAVRALLAVAPREAG